MYRLTDAYNSDGATPLATAVMAIGSALVFSLGFFLILNANNHKLASQLKHALSAIDSQDGESVKTGDFEDLTVSGESNLSGDVNADSDLTVGGSTTLTGDLSVGGKTAVNTVLGVEGDTSLGSTLAVQGKTTLSGDLDVAGSTLLQSELSVEGDTSFEGGLQLTRPVRFGGGLDVAGSSTITGGLSVIGDTTLDGSATTPDGSRFLGIALALQGSAIIGGDFEADGITTVAGALGVSGDAVFDGSMTDAGVTRLLATTGFMLQGSANISGDFEADGVAEIQGNLNVTKADSTTVFDSSQVNAANTALLASLGFNVHGAVTLAGDLEVNGTSVLNGTLAVTGTENTATFNGTGSDAQGATSLLCNIGVANANQGCSTFTVQGTTVANSFKGSFEVNGTSLIKGVIDVSGAESSTTFNGTGTNTDALGTTTTTTLLCNLGANPSPGCATFTVQGTNVANTFSGEFEVNGVAVIKGTVNVSSTDTANEPSTTFNGFVNDAAGNPTLLCNLGANPNPGCRTFDLQGLGANTFAGDFDVNGTTYIAGTINVTSPDPSSSSSVTFKGTGTDSIGNTTLLCNSAANPNCTTFYVQGAVSLSGDAEFDGTSFLNSTLSVSGSADFEGDLRVKCYSGPSGCLNTGPITVGGNVTVDNTLNAYTVVGTNNITSAEFRYNSGSGASVAGKTSTCSATEIVEVKELKGGIVTSSGCLTLAESVPCPANYHVRVKNVTRGYVTSVGGPATGSTQGCASDGSGLDLAEIYPSKQVLVAGDVVSIDTSNSEYVNLTTGTHDDGAIGVVSTEPGLTLGEGMVGYPIALSGRVPVKVTDEGGTIAAGDYLTSASTAGYAKKATPGEKTLGQALEAFTGTTGTAKMFVNVSPAQTSMQTILQAANSVQQSGAASLASLNVAGPTTLTDLTVTGTATVNNLTVLGVATVANLTVNGHIVGNDDTRGSITIPKNAKTIHHDFTTAYAKTPAVVASPTSQAVLYTVTPTATGFNINLPAAAVADLSFNYLVEE